MEIIKDDIKLLWGVKEICEFQQTSWFKHIQKLIGV